MSASASEAGGSFWRRHTALLVLIGCGLLLCVIVLGQLLDQGDVKEWLSEQSPGWAYLSIFLLVALDAVVPIFPGETTLSAASTIAADGGLQLELVMLAGALGAIVGDSSLFWIARGSSAKVKPQLDKAFKNEKIAVAWDMLQSSPGLLIVAGRYVPGMCFAVNVSMGVSAMPYRRFLPWSILGGTLWSVYTCALAYNVATTWAGVSGHLRAGYVGHPRGHPLCLPAQAEARRRHRRAKGGAWWRAGRRHAPRMTSTPQPA